jgi:hypothetical protein
LQSNLDIVAPDGRLRNSTRGIVAGNVVVIEDTSIVIEPGDEIRRKLPNGREEVFTAHDPRYYKQFGGYYQIKISRKRDYTQGTGGHYINVSGHNARVNIGSVDQFSNVVHDGTVFRDQRVAIESIPSEKDRASLQHAVGRMERASDSESFKAAYQDFISLAADHMTILAPLIPALPCCSDPFRRA